MKINLQTKNVKILFIIFFVLLILHSLFGSISWKAFVNITALEIILGGIFLSIIISFSFQDLINTFRMIRLSFRDHIDYRYTIYKVHQLSIQVKKRGLLSIQSIIDTEEDTFLKNAGILLCDYKNLSAIQDILKKDIDSRRTNLYKSYNVLKMIAHVAPAFGLTGTLIGLIGLLSDIHQTDMIMSHMASALISTLYGSLIANFVAIPLMGRIKSYIDQQILQYHMIEEGILLIAQEDSPRNVFDKMNVMLKEEERLQYPQEKRSEAYRELHEFTS